MSKLLSKNNSSLATIVLLAHERQVSGLLKLVQEYDNIFCRYRLIASPQIASQLTYNPRLSIQSVELNQIEAIVDSENVLAVIFVIDPTLTATSVPDVTDLSRICSLRNIPFASNLATAYTIINSLIPTRVAHLIFNPIAGQRDATEDLLKVRQMLAPWLHLHVHLTTRDLDADQLAQQAIAAKPDLIIASGGDGTVSLVGSQMIGSGIPLGIIPRGTANALSVALGIPTTVEGACQLIIAGTTRRLDAAHCNQHLMTLLAGIGFEAETVGKATRELKNQWGVLAYLIAGWEQLGQQELITAELEIDEQLHQFQAFAVTVANSAPPTSVLAQGVGEVVFDDGLLDITIITAKQALQPTITSKLQTARYLMNLYGSALIKAKAELPNLYHFRAKRLKLRTSSPQKIVVDGEMVGTTPLEVSCIPSALTVFAPAKHHPSTVENIASLWVRKVSPSLSALIATLGFGGLVGIPIALWGVIAIATNLLPGQTEDIENYIIWQIQQWTPAFLDQVMLFITVLANKEVVVPGFLIVISLLLRKRDYWKTGMFFLALVGAGIMNHELMLLFRQTRPYLRPLLISDGANTVLSNNFLQGTVFYGAIAYFLTLRFPRFARWIYGGAIVLVGAIGLSRISLGIQWPLDVLAGWSGGFLWLSICIILLRLKNIRSSVKQRQKKMIL
ncbi:MAG: diacylglycerol kinase family protein [Cyanobacteria bacterium P01_F01_bin.143]